MFLSKISRGRAGETPLTRILRLMGVVAVFILVSVLYWHYYEHSLDQIMTKQSVWDQTKTLTTDQKRAIQSFSRMLKSRYGMNLKLKITREHVVVPALNAKTMFIGICPDRQEVTVIFPPLMRSALGTRFEDYLNREHFTPYWQDGQWHQGLGSALALIGEQLEKLDDHEHTN
ncbi:hypothetical protein [Desulfoplanes formicivorans]|uniref:TPM domain-containing protein n=1 Tax=Desulfoplanes formicivorans TaxID=1592317 RepID=A0A194AFQ4_9BACT|nr:hypothetical protein [Desulfoplanes formicivorans]GAU08035.1 hypothetical protein DPF_0736 [Desulfoplanes formicivorans]